MIPIVEAPYFTYPPPEIIPSLTFVTGRGAVGSPGMFAIPIPPNAVSPVGPTAPPSIPLPATQNQYIQSLTHPGAGWGLVDGYQYVYERKPLFPSIGVNDVDPNLRAWRRYATVVSGNWNYLFPFSAGDRVVLGNRGGLVPSGMGGTRLLMRFKDSDSAVATGLVPDIRLRSHTDFYSLVDNCPRVEWERKDLTYANGRLLGVLNDAGVFSFSRYDDDPATESTKVEWGSLSATRWLVRGNLQMKNAGTFIGTLTPTTLAAARTWTFPDASGTVLLTGAASGLFTAQAVPFAASTGLLTEDPTNLFYVSANSRLVALGHMRVGTATDATVQGEFVAGVAGSGRMFWATPGTSPGLRFYNAAGTLVMQIEPGNLRIATDQSQLVLFNSAGFVRLDGSFVSFSVSTVEKARVSARGNLEIGTTSDASAGDGKLLIFGDNAADPTISATVSAIYRNGSILNAMEEILRVGSSSALARLRFRGVYAASPANPPSGEADCMIVDNGVAPVFRVRYNMAGTMKVGDLALV